MLGIVAKIHRLKPLDGANEQRGAGDEHDGERQLRADENTTRASPRLAVAAGSRVRSQRRVRIDARGREARRDAEEKHAPSSATAAVTATGAPALCSRSRCVDDSGA